MPKTQYIQQKEKSQPLFMKRGDILSEFFEISDKAREGGMGDVFFCRDKRDNKFYVLKTFKNIEDKSNNRKDLIDFDKEAIASLQMPRLPYVVFTKTLVADGTKQYLVMDFIGKQPCNLEESVQGETLARVLKNTKIEYKQALIWAIEFCRGMRNLHKYGIPVHKDIKLDNILLAPDNTICITDFGLSVLNKKGGTKGYFPPEYHDTVQLTEKSDIYSFGVVLYQLFFNTFSTELNQEKIEKNSLLKHCLQKNPKERYQSFAHLEQDLKKELKKLFPEYKLPVVPSLSMTADDYFLKGLGLYILDATYEKDLQPLKLAEKLLSKSIKLNPHNPVAYYYRARVLAKQYPFAERHIENKERHIIPDNAEKRAIRKIQFNERYSQQHSAFYANLIELEHYRQQQDSTDSSGNIVFLKRFKKYSDEYPHDPFLHNNLGVFEAKMNRCQKAVEEFTKAIKLLPDYAVAYANRASVYLWLNQEEKALKDCAKYTQLRCKTKLFIPISLFYGIYVQIFDWYCRQKKYDKAYAWYEKHLDLFSELKPTDRQKMLNRVRFQIQYYHLTQVVPSNYGKKHLKEYKDIWKLWKQIQQEKIPVEPDNWFDKQEMQSLRLANWGFSRYPNMRLIFYHRMCVAHPQASIFNEVGYYIAQWKNEPGAYNGRRAIPYFTKAIAADNIYAPAYYNRARAYQECGSYAQAIADYTKAIELAPEQVSSSSTRYARYVGIMSNIIVTQSGTWSMTPIQEVMRLSITKNYYCRYIGDHVDIKTYYERDDEPLDHKRSVYSPILARAKGYFDLGKYKKALFCLERAESLQAPVLHLLKGKCLYKLGRYKEALNCLLSNECDGRDSEALIAFCYAKLGNKHKEDKYALQAFMSFLSLIQKRPREIPARILKELISGFEKYYKYCLANNQFFSRWDILENMFNSAGSPSEGLKTLLKKPLPFDERQFFDNAYFQRAECYFALKDYEHALKDYKRALHIKDIKTCIKTSYIEQRIARCEETWKKENLRKNPHRIE